MVRRLRHPRAGPGGYYAHRRAAADLTFEGNWLLFGDKFRGGRPYAHAVALRGAARHGELGAYAVGRPKAAQGLSTLEMLSGGQAACARHGRSKPQRVALAGLEVQKNSIRAVAPRAAPSKFASRDRLHNQSHFAGIVSTII
jgi:hypothetical protein